MKITVQLSVKAEAYFNEVAYSLEGKKGLATHSEIINHLLETLAMFEEDAEMDLLHYMVYEQPHLFTRAVRYCKEKKLNF